MNITVIGPTYPYKGGISHFTTLLVESLRKKHTVDLISWKRQYPSFLYPVDLKDTQSKKPIKTDARFLLDFFNPYSWIQAVFALRNKQTELLVLTWASPVQAPVYMFICLLTKLVSRTKILYICHNVLPHEQAVYDKPLLRLAFYFADSFIVHSSEDKQILQRLVGNKKITKSFLPLYDIFPKDNSYDTNKIKNDLGLSKKVLLFFGYIRPYKGLRYLLEALPHIRKQFPDTNLLVVGEFWSKDKTKYIELLRKLAIDDSVVFVDTYVPNELLGKYFAVADVVVLPYITATQSAALQTAYAFHKPVISTTVGGLKDVVKDGLTGYSIRPHSSEDIVEKVKKFFTSWKNSEKLTEFTSQFSWENYVLLLEEAKQQ